MEHTPTPRSDGNATMPLVITDTIDRSLEHLTDEFADQFHGIFARETIERYVFESYTALYRTAKIKNYLIVFTERFTRDRLTALAKNKGAVVSEVCPRCCSSAFTTPVGPRWPRP